MNGLERISRRIAEDTQKEIDDLLGTAKAEADRIAAQYQAQADAEAKELSERNAKAAAEREERLAGTAQMESRKVILAARQDMVEQAYALALKKLTSLPEEQYISVLASLMAEASEGGKGEVVFSAADRDKVGKKAVEKANRDSGKNLTLSKDTAPIQAGFILREEKVEVNCAFETLVRLQRTETAGAVAKKLFP